MSDSKMKPRLEAVAGYPRRLRAAPCERRARRDAGHPLTEVGHLAAKVGYLTSDIGDFAANISDFVAQFASQQGDVGAHSRHRLVGERAHSEHDNEQRSAYRSDLHRLSPHP